MTIEDVWEGYQALHRYAQHVGVIGPVAVPKQLASPLHGAPYKAARALAPYLDQQQATLPLPIPTVQYAYYFLFAQLLRVSRPTHPTMTQAGRWANLQWRPLRGLLKWTAEGTLDDKAMGGMWRWWIYTYVQSQKNGITALPDFFPWIPKLGTTDPNVVRRQVSILWGLMDLHDLDAGTILASISPLSRVTDEQAPNEWHPWLILGRPEAWNLMLPYESTRCQIAVETMCETPGLFQTWYRLLPLILADLSTPPQRMLSYMERYIEMRYRKGSRRWKTWRSAAKKLLSL